MRRKIALGGPCFLIGFPTPPNAALEERVLRNQKTNVSYPFFEIEKDGTKFKLILGPSVALVILGIGAMISDLFGSHGWTAIFGAGALGRGIVRWFMRGRY
jgi:hypothetical protein